MANVTGLKYDRVEVKYYTNFVEAGRSECEIRLAVMRHDPAGLTRQCVSASGTIHLSGNQARNWIGTGKFRWMHGLQFGWDYTDEDKGIYTLDLQYRYRPNTLPVPEVPNHNMVYAFIKSNTVAESTWPKGILQGDGASNVWAPGVRPSSGNTTPTYGWISIPYGWDSWLGTIQLSQMHYCIGMPQERLPEATRNGWHWYSGGSTAWVRPADITEPYLAY
ncbi:hypothetical protein [Streptomyces sp. NPDC002644]